MKNIIVVTGGAGFIGSNLIEKLLLRTNYKILSLDNYSTGSKKNHIKSSRVKYFKGDTKNIENYFLRYQKNIHALFHLGEFSRIAQSFKFIDELKESNIVGSTSVINFCMKNKIRIIYSATSAAFGKNFKHQNLSPYAFTKTNILNLILNYAEWFKLKYNIVYFYNVYGKRQILDNDMAAVIGIFEHCKESGKVIPIVSPGTQSRIFTHIDDIVDACIQSLKNKKIKHMLIKAKQSHSIIKVAKMFNNKYRFVKPRKGERFASSAPKSIRGLKIKIYVGKKKLSDYILNKYKNY